MNVFIYYLIMKDYEGVNLELEYKLNIICFFEPTLINILT
jgi:hypothetical protein